MNKIKDQFHFFNNKKLILEYNIGKLILLIIFFSSIFFNGGVSFQIDFNPINNYIDLFYFLAYLILPLLSSYILYNIFKNETLIIKIHHHSIYIINLLLIYIISNYLTNLNLYSDEIYYSIKSFIYIHNLLDIDNITVIPSIFLSLPYAFIVRSLLGVQWIITILLFLWMFNKLNQKKLLIIFLFFIFFIKLILIIFKIDSSIHPPLNYFFPSLTMLILGVKSISIKISVMFVHIIFITYIINRLKLSFISSILISLAICSIPIIGHYMIYFDQAMYSYICYTVVLIEIYYKKIRPKYLFLIISIFVLFRFTNIAAYLVAFIYAILFYNNHKIDLIDKIKKLITSALPIFLILPYILIPILKGTPSTNSINTIKFSNIFTNSLSHLSILGNSFNILEMYTLIPLLFCIYLILNKEIKTFFYFLAILLSYHLIHQSSNAPIYESKYYLEQLGFAIIFPIIFFFDKMERDNYKKYYHRLLVLSFLTIALLSYSIYFKEVKMLSDKNINNIYNQNQTFSPIKNHNNHLDYIHDLLKTNKLYDQSLIIGIDYGFFPITISDISYRDYLMYSANRNKYISYKKENKTHWLDLDINALNKLKNINIIIITDYLFHHNKKNIDIFEKQFKWNIITYLPKSYNHSALWIYSKSNINI